MYYTITKRMEISASHKLELEYDSPCSKLHGHNWIIKVDISTKKLNKEGMVLDFSIIRDAIKDKIDHECLNDVLDFNPTAENIAKWIADELHSLLLLLSMDNKIDASTEVTKVTVKESEGNIACYTP